MVVGLIEDKVTKITKRGMTMDRKINQPTTDSNNKEFIGTKLAAEQLGIGRSTIQRWIDNGHIRASRTLGGHRRVNRDDLVDFARKQGIVNDSSFSMFTVLLVDDDRLVLRILSQLISDAFPDIRVLTAENGFEAGAILAQSTPQLVFLDILMPGISGIEVCGVIKDKLGMETRVIGITASTNQRDKDELIQAGAEDVLAKPFDRSRIKDLVEECLVEYIVKNENGKLHLASRVS